MVLNPPAESQRFIKPKPRHTEAAVEDFPVICSHFVYWAYAMFVLGFGTAAWVPHGCLCVLLLILWLADHVNHVSPMLDPHAVRVL